MPKRKPGEEIFKDGDDDIRFVADFGFLVSVSSYGRDVSLVFADISSGLMPPEDVRNVLVSALVDVEESKRPAFIEGLIGKYGILECSSMAYTILCHAMIGDVKKSRVDRGELAQALLTELLPTRSTNIIKLGSLWAAVCLISTGLTCLIFKFSGLPTF